MSRKWMQVHVVTTEDALFGNMVEAKLAAQLPEYESDVIEVSWPKSALVSDDNEDAAATAEQIVQEVFGSFDWLIENQ